MEFEVAALILLVIITCLAYYAHVPLPDGIMGQDRYKVQLMMDIGNIIFMPYDLLVYFGCGNASAKFQRALFNLLPQPVRKAEGVTTKILNLDGIPAEQYCPQLRRGSGAVIFIHGGGWTVGSVGMYRSLLQVLANRIKKPVVSIEYRLAPEHPFPAGLEDCEKAVRYYLDEGHALNEVDPHEIAICGDSAGGNLATVVAQRLYLNPAKYSLKAQILIYPVTQMANFQLPSYLQGQSYSKSRLLTPRQMIRFHISYMGLSLEHVKDVEKNLHVSSELKASHQYRILNTISLPDSFKYEPISTTKVVPSSVSGNPEPGTSDIHSLTANFLFNPDVSPIHREPLSGLPITFLMTCGYDVLRDEGYLYAQRLKEAGVTVTYKHYPTAMHTAFNMPYLSEGLKLHYDIAAFIKDILN